MPLREPRWRHPELQPGWIDRPHQTLALGELQLESGEAIRDFETSYVAHGSRACGDGAMGRQCGPCRCSRYVAAARRGSWCDQ